MLMTFYGMRRIRDYRLILAQRQQVNANASTYANATINNIGIGNSRNENVNADLNAAHIPTSPREGLIMQSQRLYFVFSSK